MSTPTLRLFLSQYGTVIWQFVGIIVMNIGTTLAKNGRAIDQPKMAYFSLIYVFIIHNGHDPKGSTWEKVLLVIKPHAVRRHMGVS